MDFERDPTEDEIPRFVVERRPCSSEEPDEETTQYSCSNEATTQGSCSDEEGTKENKDEN
ncbi:hypothetical protein OESDEN_14697 [Oesophagostomum dentatum]|uniref:Uncharacterized protein n=1 Tax=Oesophagostomum dentatum TaxID=61180 RepID=A0A0B1SPZ8_OESDE|nr:hypothetical protein OESDEN_14697 [Oesophagostomum dentatum]